MNMTNQGRVHPLKELIHECAVIALFALSSSCGNSDPATGTTVGQVNPTPSPTRSPRPTPSPTPTSAPAPLFLHSGIWGGTDSHLSVSMRSSFIQFPCAHGSIGSPIRLNARNRFIQRGTYALESGAPPPPGQPPLPTYMASYEGEVSGPKSDLLKLDVYYRDRSGSLYHEVHTLTFGDTREIPRCP